MMCKFPDNQSMFNEFRSLSKKSIYSNIIAFTYVNEFITVDLIEVESIGIVHWDNAKQHFFIINFYTKKNKFSFSIPTNEQYDLNCDIVSYIYDCWIYYHRTNKQRISDVIRY